MNATIFEVLQVLNEIEVKGEKNHDMLLYAIRKLKPLQSMQLVPAGTEESKEVEQNG